MESVARARITGMSAPLLARARSTGMSAPLLTGGGDDNVKLVLSILARDARHVERFRGLLLRGVSERFLRGPRELPPS